MRSAVWFAALLLAACSNQPRTPVEEGAHPVVSAPETPPRTALDDAHAACAADPRSATKQRAYFDAFPSDYASLRRTFGYEDISADSVAFGEHYEQGNDMIGAFFNLDSVPAQEIAAKAIGIAHDGVWQADGVGYFQHYLMKHLEGTPMTYLGILKSSARADQAGFWKFFTDGPEAFPQEDKVRLRGFLDKEPAQLEVLDSVLALPHIGH